MGSTKTIITWGGIAVLGAFSFAAVALTRSGS